MTGLSSRPKFVASIPTYPRSFLQAACERVAGGFTEVMRPNGRTPAASERLHTATEGSWMMLDGWIWCAAKIEVVNTFLGKILMTIYKNSDLTGIMG